MSTGYNKEELERLHWQMLVYAPSLPTLADLLTAPSVTAATWNGSYTGIVLQLQFLAEQSITVDLNCVCAVELMNGINDRAHEYGWWDQIQPGRAPEDTLPLFKPELKDKTLKIISLATGAIPEGIGIRFKDSVNGTTLVLLPRSIARGVAIAIITLGEAAKWWDANLVLQTAQKPRRGRIIH